MAASLLDLLDARPDLRRQVSVGDQALLEQVARQGGPQRYAFEPPAALPASVRTPAVPLTHAGPPDLPTAADVPPDDEREVEDDEDAAREPLVHPEHGRGVRHRDTGEERYGDQPDFTEEELEARLGA